MDAQLPKFNRITDRSRRVLDLADGEAARLGHAATHTGHVLLGLIAEGEGVAACVLRDAEVRDSTLAPYIETRHLSPSDAWTEISVLETAAGRFAAILRHKYIGTEHLLLGLCAAESCIGAQALRSIHQPLNEIGQEVLNLLGHFNLDWHACLEKCGQPDTSG